MPSDRAKNAGGPRLLPSGLRGRETQAMGSLDRMEAFLQATD
jgi:hypothetical protein